MIHDGAFQYISYIYRVGAPSIPKISFLPVLEPTEKISNTHTYEHTYIRTHSPLLYRFGIYLVTHISYYTSAIWCYTSYNHITLAIFGVIPVTIILH